MAESKTDLSVFLSDDGASDDEKVDAACERLTTLEAALKSRRHTVQVMPDGIEIIHVESGDLERKFALMEVDRGA